MREPILNFLAFLRTHQLPLTIACALSMAMYLLYKHKWRDRESV